MPRRKQNTPTADSVGEAECKCGYVGVACALLYYYIVCTKEMPEQAAKRQRQSLKVNFILIFIYVCA